MLDILGGMTLTAVSILCVGALALTGAGDPAWRTRLAVSSAAWFVAMVVLSSAELFSRTGQFGMIALVAAVTVPLVAGVVVLSRSPRAHFFANSIPLPVLVGVHAGRLLGVLFLALYQSGHLPATFALTAGRGD
ncbi:MAG: hypothetical protein ACRENS_12470, partial [Candidatus Eiseniibacteriota bacterium]